MGESAKKLRYDLNGMRYLLYHSNDTLERQHGLNQYDFGARWYDPARPGTTTMDPLAERRPWESEPIRKNHKFRELEKVDDVRFHKTNGKEYFK